jgi:hypothetical protein
MVFYQLVYPPTATAPSVLTTPFKSPGNAFVSTPMANSAFPFISSSTGIPGTVAWPPAMGNPSAGGVLAGHQWAPAAFAISTSSGVIPSGPGLNSNSSGANRDPFAPMDLSSLGPVPLVPARRLSPSNPFTGSLPHDTRSDPFAEFAVIGSSGPTSTSLSGSGLPHIPGRKTDKKDFFQDVPKPPTLFDLTQQRQTPPTIPVRDLFGSTQVMSYLVSDSGYQYRLANI